ncbi:MAG TPA: AbrB/MazE/SpoVT family DNA-binding domain-containing protein [Chloroflexota bacterium]|jgi:antitoxin component of MazEF toxin-antitoxin module|nr:AbrB/MazE/SpoVT family DNA-binding domain-containing protein [Chloroflexota bacterium]
MIIATVRKSGNSLVVTLPKEEVERLDLREGALVSVELRRLEVRPVLPPEWQAAVEREVRLSTKALQWLADH